MGTQKNGSFEHPKHMFKLMDKKSQFYANYFCLTGPMGVHQGMGIMHSDGMDNEQLLAF